MPTTKTDPALRDDALALHHAMTDLVRAYQFCDRDAICCYDVSVVQSQALERLARDGALTVNEFAASLFLEKSSASRLIDGLERKGYVARRPSETDGRVVRLELTSRGRRLAERLEEDLARERGALLEELTIDERATVLRAMRRLADAAAAAIETDGGCRVRRSTP